MSKNKNGTPKAKIPKPQAKICIKNLPKLPAKPKAARPVISPSPTKITTATPRLVSCERLSLGLGTASSLSLCFLFLPIDIQYFSPQDMGRCPALFASKEWTERLIQSYITLLHSTIFRPNLKPRFIITFQVWHPKSS